VQDQQRRGVGPLQVVDGEDERAGGQLLHQGEDRLHGPKLVLGGGDQWPPTGRGPNLLEHPRDLGTPGVGGGPVDPQAVDDRPEGPPPLQLLGGRPEHLQAEPSGLPKRLLHEAGLADAGLPFDEEAAARPTRDRFHGAGQLAELAGAAEQVTRSDRQRPLPTWATLRFHGRRCARRGLRPMGRSGAGEPHRPPQTLRAKTDPARQGG
jgi:hypothetical protein